MHRAMPTLMAGLVLALAASQSHAENRSEATLESHLKKATVQGKYQMLLGQILVDNDKDAGDFKDLGLQSRTEYAGHKNLPKGHWVYVKPYWYIWRDVANVARSRGKRNWGPEQATGEPDTQGAGDIPTAWASQNEDEQDEWLTMEYSEPVSPSAVLVYETYNPGALMRITAFKLDGTEVELWKGQDPTSTDNDSGVSEVPVKCDFKTNRIRIYLASTKVSGWNEIDAVGLRDKEKKVHWAVSADASSTFAPPFESTPPRPLVTPNITDMRIKKLEEEVRELKAMLEELRKKVDKKDK